MAARRRQERLIIEIANNGAAIAPAALAEIREMLAARHNFSTHSGLYNIHRRVQLLYGEAYGVTIDSSAAEGTCVKLTIPYQRKEETDA